MDIIDLIHARSDLRMAIMATTLCLLVAGSLIYGMVTDERFRGWIHARCRAWMASAITVSASLSGMFCIGLGLCGVIASIAMHVVDADLRRMHDLAIDRPEILRASMMHATMTARAYKGEVTVCMSVPETSIDGIVMDGESSVFRVMWDTDIAMHASMAASSHMPMQTIAIID
jgi:hypothetical protein